MTPTKMVGSLEEVTVVGSEALRNVHQGPPRHPVVGWWQLGPPPQCAEARSKRHDGLLGGESGDERPSNMWLWVKTNGTILG